MLENRLKALFQAKDQAFIIGDLERLNSVDSEINEVQNTLSKLRLFADITEAAVTAKTTETAVVEAGVEAIQNVPDTPDSAAEIIGDYDITDYATDPLYLQKISGILSNMPLFSTAGVVDMYIQAIASASPITGQMIFSACQHYAVDIKLLTAILQLE